MALLHERQAKFEQDVRESLVRLEERKRGDAKSTRGGYTYEDAVLRFVQRAVQGAPIEVNTTANTVGAKPACKKGDQVLRFTAESAYAGGALVVEAKRDSSYTVRAALEELELDLLLRKAKSTLKALDVELTEAEEAKSAPVMLPAGSLVQARAAIEAQCPSEDAIRKIA